MRRNANNLIIIGSSFDISSGAPNILSDHQQTMWRSEADILAGVDPEYTPHVLATDTFLHLGSIAADACVGEKIPENEYMNPYRVQVREIIRDNFTPDESLESLVTDAIKQSWHSRRLQVSARLFQSAIEQSSSIEAELTEKQSIAAEIIKARGHVELAGYVMSGTAGKRLKLTRQNLSVPYYASFAEGRNEIELMQSAIADLRSIATAIT